MAGWISGSESDEEPLNLNLFNRKCFGFLGIPEKTVNTFKNVVQVCLFYDIVPYLLQKFV